MHHTFNARAADVYATLGTTEAGALLAMRLVNAYGARGLAGEPPHARMNDRLELAAQIAAARRPDGTMLVGETGRSCDGVEYAHRPRAIPATAADYWREVGLLDQWADGPFRLHVLTEEQAAAWRPYTRDRVLEAFEDGHPHCIVSAFPG